ncbi:MAG: extracellular solute-binding protein [Clostridia bacterium]|nr:extracellular solute-binding protein [Clostridia bacterium]
MKRTLSILLLLTMLLGSCGESAANADTAPDNADISPEVGAEETVIDDETRPMHKVPELDLEGGVFNILYPNWQGYPLYFFADEVNGDPMNDALFNRTTIVEEYLNIDITQTEVPSIVDVSPSVQQSVTAQDDAYQLALTHCIQNVASMVTGGYLYNYDNLPYVDYNAEWWNHRMMDVLRLGSNTYYGVSDYMIPCPYAIFFNKSLVTDYNLESPYELVYNGQWTIDKLCEMAVAVTTDTDGDGQYTTEDIVGLGSGDGSTYISFMTGADQFMTTKNAEGRVELAMNTDRMITIVEKLANLANTTGVVQPNNAVSLKDGKVLFMLSGMAGLINYRDAEVDIGVLPYPKFDEAQENYVSLDWGGLMCIPTTVGNPELVGAALELLAYESANEVIPTYYDVLLEGKLARDTDTIAMLDILFDTIAYEVGGNYFGFEAGLSDLFYTTCRLAVEQKSTDFASWYKSKEKVAAKVLDRFYSSLEKVEAGG